MEIFRQSLLILSEIGPAFENKIVDPQTIVPKSPEKFGIQISGKKCSTSKIP